MCNEPSSVPCAQSGYKCRPGSILQDFQLRLVPGRRGASTSIAYYARILIGRIVVSTACKVTNDLRRLTKSLLYVPSSVSIKTLLQHFTHHSGICRGPRHAYVRTACGYSQSGGKTPEVSFAPVVNSAYLAGVSECSPATSYAETGYGISNDSGTTSREISNY
jgi:hypothetical protein